MGLSSTLATVFIAVILIMGFSVNILVILSTTELLRTAVRDSVTLNVKSLRESIEIKSIAVNGSTGVITMNVTNSGEYSIFASKFELIDLILVYRNARGILHSLWIPFSQNGSSTPYWRVIRVSFLGEEGELVNPLVLNESNIRGAWDPQETLEIEISTGEVLNGSLYVFMWTPSGSKASIALSL